MKKTVIAMLFLPIASLHCTKIVKPSETGEIPAIVTIVQKGQAIAAHYTGKTPAEKFAFERQNVSKESSMSADIATVYPIVQFMTETWEGYKKATSSTEPGKKAVAPAFVMHVNARAIQIGKLLIACGANSQEINRYANDTVKVLAHVYNEADELERIHANLVSPEDGYRRYMHVKQADEQEKAQAVLLPSFAISQTDLEAQFLKDRIQK